MQLERRGAIALVTLSNVRARNALTLPMTQQLWEICDEIDKDATIGCAVLRGAEGTFCSGADHSIWDARPRTADGKYDEASAMYDAVRRVGSLTVPSIAAVRGAAVGAGLNVALAADLRIVSEDARLIGGFLRIGLHPGGGFFTICSRLAGREVTAGLGLFGEEISGSRAVDAGLAFEALPDQDVEERAVELAGRVALDPLLARRATRSFRTELGPPAISWDAALELERGVQIWSADRVEEGVGPPRPSRSRA